MSLVPRSSLPFFTSLHPVGRAAEVNRPSSTFRALWRVPDTRNGPGSFTTPLSLPPFTPTPSAASCQFNFFKCFPGLLRSQKVDVGLKVVCWRVLQSRNTAREWLRSSLKENSTFDRKSRLRRSCCFYAKICTHEHAAAPGECLASAWRAPAGAAAA